MSSASWVFRWYDQSGSPALGTSQSIPVCRMLPNGWSLVISGVTGPMSLRLADAADAGTGAAEGGTQGWKNNSKRVPHKHENFSLAVGRPLTQPQAFEGQYCMSARPGNYGKQEGGAPQGLVVAQDTARLGEAAVVQLPTLGSMPKQSPLLQTGIAGYSCCWNQLSPCPRLVSPLSRALGPPQPPMAICVLGGSVSSKGTEGQRITQEMS